MKSGKQTKVNHITETDMQSIHMGKILWTKQLVYLIWDYQLVTRSTSRGIFPGKQNKLMSILFLFLSITDIKKDARNVAWLLTMSSIRRIKGALHVQGENVKKYYD